VKQNFLKRFSNFNFRRKKRDEKKKKEGRAQFVFNYHTLLQESNNSTHFLPFVPDREISDMILIIRSNISSNYYNQYY